MEARGGRKEGREGGRHLFVQMTDPLGKLARVGDGGREEHVVHIVRKQNDCLLPHNTSLWEIDIYKTGYIYMYSTSQ